MTFSIDLTEELEKEASFAREKPITNNGSKMDREGIAFESIVRQMILDKDDRILSWLGLLPDDIIDVVIGHENIKKYTYNTKIDLIIVTHKRNIGFSLKCTGQSVVGALETSLEMIGMNVNMSSIEYISFQRFAENGYKIKGMKGHNIDIIKKLF